jgi:preprotein translocase YajC subunit
MPFVPRGRLFDMHLTSSLHYFLLAAAKTTSTTTKSTSSATSDLPLLALIVIFALLYFGWMRPNQRRRMEAMRQRRAFDLGDEVVAGGMMGRVVRISEDQVDVEVADGVAVSFVPQAVQSKAAYLASQRGGGRRALGGGFSGPASTSSRVGPYGGTGGGSSFAGAGGGSFGGASTSGAVGASEAGGGNGAEGPSAPATAGGAGLVGFGGSGPGSARSVRRRPASAAGEGGAGGATPGFDQATDAPGEGT